MLEYMENISQSEAENIRKPYRICFARPVFCRQSVIRLL